MVIIKHIEMSAPIHITIPIGPQSGVALMTIGMTPIDAAADVRKMGRKRWRADSSAASTAVRPCSWRSSSA